MDLRLPPLHDDLAFLSPMSEGRADRLALWLAEGLDRGTVLDVGCGWAELLLRVVQLAPRAHGIGVDRDVDRITEARVRAARRGLGDRVRLSSDDLATVVTGPVDALAVVGSSQVWGHEVAEALALDYTAALRGMRDVVRRGARVLYAEAIWSRPPTPAATAALSGRDDELVDLPELVRLVGEHGFAVAGVGEAGLEEWDDFESGFTAGHATWLAEHDPDHPDAPEVRRRVREQQSGYLAGYRGVLGMAYLQLLAV